MLDVFKKLHTEESTGSDIPVIIDEPSLLLDHDKKGYYIKPLGDVCMYLEGNCSFEGPYKKIIELFQQNKEKNIFTISWDEDHEEEDYDDEEERYKLYLSEYPHLHHFETSWQKSRSFFSGLNKVKEQKIEPPKTTIKLRDYQIDGLKWLHYLMKHKIGGCLADDMDIEQALQHQLILTTYHTLRSDIEKIRKHAFDIVILDESQHIKNPQSQVSKAVTLLQANNRFALSGTPIENNLGEMYAL